jgi:hypothetical protein
MAMALAVTAAMGASWASASQFRNPGALPTTQTTWNGSLVGKNHVLTFGSEKFTCSKVAFSGKIEGESASELTTTPELGGCQWNLGLEVSWAMHGCKFRFRPGTVKGTTSIGWVDIVGCESPMSVSGGGCTEEIGNQNGIGSITYKTTKPGSFEEVLASAQLTNIVHTRSGFCGGAPLGTYSDGAYTGEWTIKGNRSGAQVHVQVALSGPSKFNVEEAPATISGTNTGVKAFNFGEDGYLWCEKTTYSGSSSSVTATSLTVVPAYQACTWYEPFGVKSYSIPNENVSTGSCNFTLGANGSFGISGTNCASSPISVARTGCTVTVGPQSDSTGLAYTQLGSGKWRGVEMVGSVGAALSYTATGASCPAPGTFSNGYFPAKAAFFATNSGGKEQGLWLE